MRRWLALGVGEARLLDDCPGFGNMGLIAEGILSRFLLCLTELRLLFFAWLLHRL